MRTRAETRTMLANRIREELLLTKNWQLPNSTAGWVFWLHTHLTHEESMLLGVESQDSVYQYWFTAIAMSTGLYRMDVTGGTLVLREKVI